MMHHHWLSLGFAFFSALFILPHFTQNILFWSLLLFVGSYAFLDVGHARIYRAKPNVRGLDTALITGSSHGIGEEFAKLFARDGFNVILVARSEGDLQRVKNELLTMNPTIKVHYVVKDLGRESAAEEIFHELCENQEIQNNFRITHLINNAGVGYTGEFLSIPIECQLETIKTIGNSMVQLCFYFGNYFRQQKQRFPNEEYRIMNMSSIAAFSAAPNFAVYHAIKSFIHSFTIALHEELLPSHISVTSLCPGITQTYLLTKSGVSKKNLPLISPISQPSEVAKIGYRALFANRRYAIVGYANYMFAFAFMFLPYWMQAYVNQFFYSERVSEYEEWKPQNVGKKIAEAFVPTASSSANTVSSAS